ncbi:UDP-N-acetylmuramyl-tripeptide synthetase [Candidatus Wolfebacteria bacterium]|nr:UDP-N-acetylmuramyl-tripeptide synthetase [Candidatus Wolfebacteria bacterium]
MLEKLLSLGRKVIPKKLFRTGQPTYHYLLALASALIYRFPSRKLNVVAVTGTKGKSTTTELINAILEGAGFRTAVLNTIRFKVGKTDERNLYKMTIPGRFFTQRFLRRAVNAGCDWAVLEMTSEGAKQFRHKFIHFDALVFTNLSPEHIESHGSYEKYRDAKLAIGRQLEKSRKPNCAVIANIDDVEGSRFLGLRVSRSFPYSLENAKPYEKTEDGFRFLFRNTLMHTHLPGMFNLYNALAAATFAASQNITPADIATAFDAFTNIRGRVEYVTREPFAVVVDYAHTPDSLKQFYSVFTKDRNICVLGNTGGGRDRWKRPEMARIAEEHCTHVILTNEDPYDENPEQIIQEMSAGVADKKKLEAIMDRRQAIRHALEIAHPGDNVLITGKGTDPYIMEAHGTKTPWDDATVVREELKELGFRN